MGFVWLGALAGAQESSPIDVQVLPSLNGETPVQISVKPQETPVTLEIPELRPVSLAPTPRPAPAAAAPGLKPMPSSVVPQPTPTPVSVRNMGTAVPGKVGIPSVSAATASPLPAGVAEEGDMIHARGKGLNLAEPVRDELEAIPPGTAAETEEVGTSESLSLPLMSANPASGTLSVAGSAAEDMLRRRFDGIKVQAQQGQPEEARQEMHKLASDFPGSAIAPEALFAAAQLERSSVQSRVAELLSITTRYPNTVWAARSFEEIGVGEMAMGNQKAALEAFRSSRASTPEAIQETTLPEMPSSSTLPQSTAGSQASSIQANIITCLFQLKRYDEALSELEKMESDFAADAQSGKMMDMKADCLMALRRYDDAISTLRTLEKDNADSPLAAKALLCQGLCFEQIGRMDEAKGIYDVLLRKFAEGNGGAGAAEAGFARERTAELAKGLMP